ncbi:hypothetical protein B0H14DRAFT_3505776 [Mycena olivaceomarginata]|nr:hypothetical protein B0H14DRAFT_3505776 [Mycena olivaceomarginata]
MVKQRTGKTKPPNESDDYKNGIEARKRENHRRSAAAYYARHPEARKKNRINMQQRRAAAKVKKRRWDLPQTPNAAELAAVEEAEENASSSFRFQNPPSAAADSNDLPRSVDRWIEAGNSVVNRAAASTSHGLGLVSLSPTQQDALVAIAVEVLATMSGRPGVLQLPEKPVSCSSNATRELPVDSCKPGRRVQSALNFVAELNANPLTPPNWVQQHRWRRPRGGMHTSKNIGMERYLSITEWQLQIFFDQCDVGEDGQEQE